MNKFTYDEQGFTSAKEWLEINIPLSFISRTERDELFKALIGTVDVANTLFKKQETTAKVVEEKMLNINKLIGEIQAMSSNKIFTEMNCPLAKHDHMAGTKIIFGLERYSWNCKFCGKKESE